MIDRSGGRNGTFSSVAAAGCAALLIAAAGAGGADRNAVSPVHAAGPHGSGLATQLSFDQVLYEDLGSFRSGTLVGFPLGADKAVDLRVERFEVFSEDAVIVVSGPDGDEAAERPDVVLLRGGVEGRDGSRVFLGFSPHGSNGIIEVDGVTWVLASARDGGGGPVIYSLTELPEGAINWRPLECAADQLAAPGREPVGDGLSPARGDPPCRLADIAIETDWPFTQHFGGDTNASGAYAAMLIGAVSEIYGNDVNAHLRISFLRLWDGPHDPWDQNGAFDQFFQWRDYWNDNMTHIERHAAHFLTTRSLSGAGGLAYLGGLCTPEFDYGLSAYLNGHFPYPLQDNHSQNWDLMVVAHEIGHNFGAPHTHDMSPPVDQCASGGCINHGTIMSYCHICSGGMTNIRLRFHERIVDERILPFLENDAQCDLVLDAPVFDSHPADLTVSPGQSAEFAASVIGDAPTEYQWRRDGADLSDGGNITGATTDTLTIDPVEPGDAGQYTLLAANACGETESNPATLTVLDCAPDWNGDGVVDSDDLLDFLADWSAGNADYNGDGVTDSDDLLEFLSDWSQGC